MRAGRITAVILGGLVAMVGAGSVIGGTGLMIIHATQRDDAGYYTTATERYQTPTAAMVVRADLGDESSGWVPDHPIGTVRVTATAADQGPLFIGIGPAAAVDSWLAGTSHEEITGMGPGDIRTHTRVTAGPGQLGPPAEQSFWAVSSGTSGTQTLTWPSQRGEWELVVMNTDARAGVVADMSAGLHTGLLLPIGAGLLGFGLLMAAIGVLILLWAVRGYHVTAQARPAGVPGTYPARLDGRLDEPLSRWRWLVKWFLAIPHVVVLALLWLAVIPLTVVAGFAILFTGRYPRSIFEFNVGVMRWTWRVSYYAFDVLGTDRYPPFSLHPDPNYPADFTVDYPERLSRGLVLVKWWLLAIPHYIVIAILTGSGWAGWQSDGSDWRVAAGGGLIGILVFVAVVVLLFTGRYPRSMYDLVMGLNRWCYRVLAYVSLMRDEYPPFRLDQGGTDPGTPAPPTVPPLPGGDRTALPVGAGV